ncbi:hypothetical protein [Mucilaginibacter sp. FT3.2]|uniref:hypothetical protein n=1 Tax=Mucilaginibacter sp. FT3.2 TaxID=2723090 RepID=UPI001615A7A9|nr:hypothetical protein [Mucilaginibacter sp. FT3.2]MBB6231445.1 hypothetical protein [Mucilaginibacter sp. FT3.2]
MKNLSIYILFVALLASACTKKNIPHYTIARVTKSDTASKVIVNIGSRLSETELLSIAGKIKADSATLTNLQVYYLLTGHNEKSTGPNNFYATAKYPSAQLATMQDTLKDNDGNVVRLKITGLSAQVAKKFITLIPKEISGQKILGHFIDDNNATLIIPFIDVVDPQKELHLLELDTAGKVVSATIPTVVNKDGIQQLMVTQRGDYITLKDSILTQYSIDDMGLPYNSIKSGL